MSVATRQRQRPRSPLSLRGAEERRRWRCSFWFEVALPSASRAAAVALSSQREREREREREQRESKESEQRRVVLSLEFSNL